ncbi:MAG: hypothetical protein Q4D62_11770 [Planctomycetia bacterium]|nr:hypothetical protein [Planctomycetia bacterium]
MEKNTSLRKSVYAILIMASLGLILGRIFAVDTVALRGLEKDRRAQIPKKLAEKEQRLQKSGVPEAVIQEELAKTEKALEKNATLCFPFFSANDRSRWCTIRALVEPDMRVAGAPYAIDIVRMEKGWDTIDMVKHDEHYYSSKPPLFPTMLAGLYWLIYHGTGLSLAANPHLVVKILLCCVNIPLMALFLGAVAGLAERLGRGDWSRIFVVAVASFGTFLSTFCVTLNNHLPAVTCVAGVLWLMVTMVQERDYPAWKVFLAGLLAAFAVVNELPALSFLAAIGAGLFLYTFSWESWKKPAVVLFFYGVGILGVAIPFFVTNYVAHDSLRPPYMHRSEGDNWYEYTYIAQNGQVRQSYWQNPQGIDKGEPSIARYAFHVLLGHHGIFSLTPVWILAMGGLGIGLVKGDSTMRSLAWMILALTLVVLLFYIFRPLADRNYGGVCCGFRWAFWLIPMWLCTMLPMLEWVEEKRWRRGVALVLLMFSALSAAFPIWNPWSQPWLYF